MCNSLSLSTLHLTIVSSSSPYYENNCSSATNQRNTSHTFTSTHTTNRCSASGFITALSIIQLILLLFMSQFVSSRSLSFFLLYMSFTCILSCSVCLACVSLALFVLFTPPFSLQLTCIVLTLWAAKTAPVNKGADHARHSEPFHRKFVTFSLFFFFFFRFLLLIVILTLKLEKIRAP